LLYFHDYLKNFADMLCWDFAVKVVKAGLISMRKRAFHSQSRQLLRLFYTEDDDIYLVRNVGNYQLRYCDPVRGLGVHLHPCEIPLSRTV
jgi:hypothetical protein